MKQNTICIGCFQAKDYYANTVTIANIFQDGINRLRDSNWKDKQIRLFLFGDYAFLTSLYGLSGANGVHFCLFCVIKKDEMNVPWVDRADAPQRTISRIKRDYKDFSREGEGKLSNAKKYNNVIHSPLWHIPIKNVCPPYLHIMLGIIKRHHDLLEAACHSLDEDLSRDIASKMSSDCEIGTTEFRAHVAELVEGNRLEKRLQRKKSELESLKTVQMSRKIRAERNQMNKSITHITEQMEQKQQHELRSRSGPIASCLEPVLNRHNIVFQAYHGRSFIGNHCRKYIQETVITDLGDKIVAIVDSLVSDSKINMDARSVRKNFIELNGAYRDAHSRLAHSRHVSRNEANDHQAFVSLYMEKFREMSPKILPKHHLLEDHACQWIQSWQFGLGLHGEQGGEAIHREFRRLERLMMSQPNSLKRLQYIMNEHHVATHPKVLCHIISKTKRNKI